MPATDFVESSNMKKCCLILFCCCMLVQLKAQITIAGSVLDASTKLPIADAMVVLEDSSRELYSGRNGTFSMHLQQVPVRIIVSAAGYFSESRRITSAAEAVVFTLQPRAELLSEVVVRAGLIPERLLNIPASVAVLNRSELTRYGRVTIPDAFAAVPGVEVFSGALNTTKISMRGIGSRSQYGTNRIKIYFDGIPLSSADGTTTLDDIDPEVIERVELVKGPTSSLYGAGLGGAISIFPATAEAGTIAGVKSAVGSFGLRKNTISVSHSSPQAHIRVAYNRLNTNGYRENGEYGRQSFTLYGKAHGSEASQLSVLANFIHLMAYIPSSLNRTQFEKDPSSAASSWKAARGYESYDKGLFGITYKHFFSNTFSSQSTVYMNFRDAYEPRPFDILKEEQMGAGAKTQFNLSTKIFQLPLELSFGAEYLREAYHSTTFENLYELFPGTGSVAGRHLSANTQHRSYANFYGQGNLMVTGKLKLEAGANLNTTRYSIKDFFIGDSIDQSGSYQFPMVFSPRLAVVYSLTREKMLYASASHGFSPPTVPEMLTPEGLINTELEAETGWNYEVGFKGQWLYGVLYSQVVLYSMHMRNLLVAERVGQDRYVGRNAGKTLHNGAEFLLKSRFQLFTSLLVQPYMAAGFAFYEFVEFTDRDIDFSGNNLPAVPEKTVSTGVDFLTSSGFSLSLSHRYHGAMALNDANTEYAAGFHKVDVMLAYQISFCEKWNAQFSTGVLNLFNEHYAASIVPNAVGFGGTAPRYFYPGKPRNYFVGVQVGYKL